LITFTDLLKLLSELESQAGPNQLVEAVINGESAGVADFVPPEDVPNWNRILRGLHALPLVPLIDLNSGNDLVFGSSGQLYHYSHEARPKISKISAIHLQLISPGPANVVWSQIPD
jgi:hypothetical protein